MEKLKHAAGFIFYTVVILFIGGVLAAGAYSQVTAPKDADDQYSVPVESDRQEKIQDCEDSARIRYQIGLDYQENQAKLLKQKQKELKACGQ